MKSFKFFWTTHKWTGIILAAIFAVLAVSGFLLLIKKDYDWIQPPTHEGADGRVVDFISNQELFEIVLDAGDPAFQSFDDIDRVDFRPHKRVFKVRSNDYHEIQVDAVTGEILSQQYRLSDWLETLHDGSLIAGWFHDWVMPVAACGLLFLTFSGLWLWLEPKYRRAKRRKHVARVSHGG